MTMKLNPFLSEENESQDYQSVFLNMRLQWNELVASHIQREALWQRMALLSLGIALLCAGGMVYLGAQNKFIPYVVAVDKLGAAVAVQPASKASIADSRIIRAQLAAWVESVRSIYQDAGAERVNITDAYSMLRRIDPASTALNEYLSNTYPLIKDVLSEAGMMKQLQ